MTRGAIRVGVSGWSHDHWQGDFYPEDLTKSDRLRYASHRLGSLEINGSFHSLLRPENYGEYRDTAPEGFRYAVKGSRFVTHSKKLKDVKTAVANFFASGVLRLEEKLGPILWQFPQLKFPRERVENFLDLLPKDTIAAAELARRHDENVTGRASMKVDRKRRIRHALEFRDEHFLTDDVVRTLRGHNAALVFSHSGDWPYVEELTAGFAYIRLHGKPDTYASGYGPKALDRWADRISDWARGLEPGDPQRITDRAPPGRKTRDVYVYFDNDQNGYAPRDARRLTDRLGIGNGGD